MELGICLNDNMRIELTDTKDRIISMLEENEVRYMIPLDADNDITKLHETVILIHEFEVELKLINNIVVFIRSINNKYTNLFSFDECKNMTIYKYSTSITEKLAHMTDTNNFKVSIDSINLKTLCGTVICKCNNIESRIRMARDGHGNVYIQTLKLLNDGTNTFVVSEA